MLKSALVRFGFLVALLALTIGGLAAPAAAQEATPFSTPNNDRLYALSPDGTMIATTPNGGRELCIYSIPDAEQISCAPLADSSIRIDPSTFSWSPANDALVFGEQVAELLVDGDIWSFDVASGELSNLTEDLYSNPLPLLSEEEYDPIPVDFAPSWSPDGATIAFSRTTLTGADDSPTAMMLLDVASGEVTELAIFDETVAFTLPFRMVWSPGSDTIYASAFYPDPEEDRRGVWSFDTGSGEFVQIAGPNEDFTGAAPAIVAVSPLGDMLIFSYPTYIATNTDTDRRSGYVLFNTSDESSTPIEPSEPFAGAVSVTVAPNFSPDGSALIFGVRQPSEEQGYVITRDIESGEDTVLAELPDGIYPISLDTTVPMGVGGGVTFVQTSPNFGSLITLPDEISEPVENAAGETDSASEDDTAGSVILVVGESAAVLREGPSRDDAIVAVVDVGEELSALGDPFEANGAFWIEVEVISTGDTGFIRTIFLEPVG